MIDALKFLVLLTALLSVGVLATLALAIVLAIIAIVCIILYWWISYIALAVYYKLRIRELVKWIKLQHYIFTKCRKCGVFQEFGKISNCREHCNYPKHIRR